MTPEDLELVVAATGHVAYRELTAEGHPDRGFYRRRVAERAAILRGDRPPDPAPPAPEDAAARRAGKPRIPKGVRLPATDHP